LAGQACATYYSYSGVMTCGDGLTGKEQWDSELTRLAWKVTYDDSMAPYVWQYRYELIVPEKDISHFILEVSDQFTLENLDNVNGGVVSEDGVKRYDSETDGNSNPLLPGEINGIKFLEPYEIDSKHVILTFSSNRDPVWGDFYAKDGVNQEEKGKKPPVVLYNTGFVENDTDPSAPLPEPNNEPANYYDHLLVPDTTSFTPEPTLLTLLGMGGLGLLRKKRR
jgi:hypothetical protein